MEGISITTNAKEYSKVMDLYARVRRKGHAEVITRTAQQANYRASWKAGGVRRAELGLFPLNATANPEKGGKTYKQRFYYAERASHGVKKGKGGKIVMRPAAYKSWARRRSARGAIAFGFLNSARKLGLKPRGNEGVKPKKSGSAMKSTGDKARSATLQADSENKVLGSYEVGQKAMNRAIAGAIADMYAYSVKELQKINDRVERNGR